MPEGPEVRREADRVGGAIEGRVIRDVWFAFDALQQWQRRLQGRRVRKVEARGKAMLIRFEGALNIYSHNQLYGRWYVSKPGKTPHTRRQLRLALHAETASARLYSASEINVLRDADLQSHPYLGRLGPDVLDPGVKPTLVHRRLVERRFARRMLAGLLLDQGFLSGVGNYLRSEILFVAGIDARRRPADLDAPERKALARSALTISRRAYRRRGVTNDPEIVQRLRADDRPRREYRHFVFGRDGLDCHRCGTRILKEHAAGRRLYYCPECQE